MPAGLRCRRYFDFWGYQPKCINDWLVLDIGYQIRQKPNWEAKFRDLEIVAKCKAQLEVQDYKSHNFDEVFDYTLKELEWCAQPKKVSQKTNDALKELFMVLVASIEKDYHANSNNLVVDVVHRSLYPVMYGRTKEVVDGGLATIGFAEKLASVKKQFQSYAVSKYFQWLPAQMQRNKDTGKFEFSSYINNLHPIKFAHLYSDIATVLSEAFPGLACSEIPMCTEVCGPDYGEQETAIWDAESENKDDDDTEDKLRALRVERVQKFPPVWEGGPKPSDFDLSSYKHLKVIVKLAKIELTPEKPSYGGGTWLVEGTINEDIVATVLYYYDVENIADSKLCFKKSMSDPMYEQNDEVLVFPNRFQNYVDAFELEDKTKPRNRKILCFFLVDPYNTKIKTSKTVTPQQEDNEVYGELMAERSANYAEAVDEGEEAFTRAFSLYEH
ncbi:hypothetical protein METBISCDRAFT_29463 [Metschnikowia bicuspidata]|uniref:Uncharacterized protein n=1 Tax=Metschnikowia bicuspidata TaxID=27322 RepID=A0A4P9ZHC6_9ASCO|nr:hypothetical protein METBISCDRAFT_29463 [Metschnikowia bicuspidata]